MLHAECLSDKLHEFIAPILLSALSSLLIPKWSAHRNTFGGARFKQMSITHREVFHVAQS